MYFLMQEHFARAAEYAIYSVDVPCAFDSAYLQFSVNSAFSHGVYRTWFRSWGFRSLLGDRDVGDGNIHYSKGAAR